MNTVSFADKVQAGNNSVILYRGVSLSGRNFFAYLDCNREGAQKLNDDYAVTAPRDISTYGKVIYMDFLADPDEKAKAFLATYLREASELTDEE